MSRVSIVLVILSAAACRRAPAEPESLRQTEDSPSIQAASPKTTTEPAPSAAPSAAVKAPTWPVPPTPPGHRPVHGKPVAEVAPSADDPLKGKFTLEDATQGLPGTGTLYADITTSLGKLTCELYDDRAPITVANFVGLARGLRPFKNPQGEWTKSHAYDGTTFHRIIRGFMIQGGDPQGTGGGEPGYVIPDEVWEGAYHSERGLLCMANRGPNTNGMQFFIMDGSAPHLDSGYTIFGKCGPSGVIEKIAGAEVRGDRAVDPPKIMKVQIRREPAKAAAPVKPSTAPTSSAKAAPPAPSTP